MGSLCLSMENNGIYNNYMVIVALFVLYGFFILVYIPFCCYCSYKLYALRNECFVKIRNPILSQLIIAIFVVFIFQRLILRDLLCIVWNKCVDFDINDWDDLKVDPTETSMIYIKNINTFFDILFLLSCLPKIFFIYYELSLQNALLNENWWRQINDKLGENIFIKYHNNIYTFTCVGAIGFIIISVFFCYLFHSFGRILIYAITTIIVIVIAPIMYCKLPAIDDIYYVKYELKYMILILVPILIFFNVSNVFAFKYFLWHIVDCILLIMSTLFLIYMITIRPVNIILFSSKISAQQMDENNSIPKTWPQWISLSTNNFNKFMQTLSAELALENILFIIEVIQYKSNIIRKIIKLNDAKKTSKTPKTPKTPVSRLSMSRFSISTSRTEQSSHSQLQSQSAVALQSGLMIILPANVPKSAIVASKRLNLESKLLLLYKKYIQYPNAALLISISSETRHKLDTTLNLISCKTEAASDFIGSFSVSSNNTNIKYQQQQQQLLTLLLIFDDCLHEVCRLVNGSWNRFRDKLKQESMTQMEVMEQVLNKN